LSRLRPNLLLHAAGGMRACHVTGVQTCALPIWVFGADTSWGKSSLFVSVADENLRRGKRILIVSAEDPPSLYGDRLLSRRAQVRSKERRVGKECGSRWTRYDRDKKGCTQAC